jgi:VWFA-related protein
MSSLIAGLLCASALAAADSQTTIRADVNLVQFHAKVTDVNGHTISGLGKEAFELFVDDVRQTITVFQGEDAPVTAGIVMDNSASMAPKREEAIAAALAFARASNPRDQMFVVHFNDHARFGLKEGRPFTGDIAELEAAIAGFDLGGTTALYDAIMLARSQFTGAAYGKKVLLIITDGGDNASHAVLPDVLHGLLQDGAVVFAVGVFDPEDRDANPRALTQLAEVTGGAAFFPSDIADVKKICEHIAGEVRHQYTLGFPGAEDGKFHRIRVVAKDPKYGKLEVRSRVGYFAVKPQK